MRARNMQRLTDQLKAARPRIVIYGVGDAAHKLRVSGHNEDDTVGVRAEDQDSDSIPEHRAIDVMIGPAFSAVDAKNLYDFLGRIPANQQRLLYVIYNRKKRSRSNGWVEQDYTGSDPHTSHVHVSGEADDDANTSNWVLPTGLGVDMGVQITSANVQQALQDAGFLAGTGVDDDWGPASQASLTAALKAIKLTGSGQLPGQLVLEFPGMAVTAEVPAQQITTHVVETK